MAAPVGAPQVDWCVVDAPIIFSRLHDTPETIQDIKVHNAKWVAHCGMPGGAPK